MGTEGQSGLAPAGPSGLRIAARRQMVRRTLTRRVLSTQPIPARDGLTPVLRPPEATVEVQRDIQPA